MIKVSENDNYTNLHRIELLFYSVQVTCIRKNICTRKCARCTSFLVQFDLYKFLV